MKTNDLPFFVLTVLLFFQCFPDESPEPGIVFDNISSVIGVEGFLTDEAGLPISGALIRIGDQETISFPNGRFTIKEVAVL